MKTFGLLGVVNTITKTKLILVKINRKDEVPRIGSKVLDANGIEIGKIIDVIGPVDDPYAVVKPLTFAVLSSIKPSTALFYRITKEKPRARGGRK
uniref:RNA-binding protein n=1 Tax=Ignisphaera aggregans TaxID=334771 RepID=A0A7C2VH28_9CREN